MNGDYYLPDFEVIFDGLGRWAQMPLNYIAECQHDLYCELLFSGKLRHYLQTLNAQVQERLERVIQQMKLREGVTEALKASDQMEWLHRMNSIRNRAEAIVKEELIFI
ncbi:MAG: TnpV protein [Clostridia bacterium]